MARAALKNFQENLRPPIRTLAFIYFLLGSIVIAIWAALPPPATLIAFIASNFLLALAARSLSSKISVDDGVLTVGKANIETKYISNVILLDKKEMALERTVRIDPAAYLALKFWESKGVKIILQDERDSTPYWLITTKRGKELAAAILQNP
jgi:hypothetical protein